MRKRPRRRFTGWAAIGLFAWVPAFGQDSKDEIIQKLISRVDALEREVAGLKPPAPPGQVIATPPREPAPTVAVIPADASEPAAVSENRYTFHAYADVGFDRNKEGDSAKQFALGEIIFFSSARISSSFTALIEVGLETHNQIDVADVPVNVERLLLQYRRNDFFNLDIGAFRTAIGYYSTAHLRGSWFQTTVIPPEMFTFEDEGGVLPLHNVGLSANGRIPSGALGLHYVVETGSSRNYANHDRLAFDFAQNRAFNVALFARPEHIPGLQMGFSSYHDRFSPSPGQLLDRSVSTAHVVYQAKRLEFVTEGVLVKFRDGTRGYASVPEFYGQIGYRIASNWTPYFRYEFLNANGRGSQAAVRAIVPFRTIFTSGVRYDLTEAIAVKLELGRETNWFQPPWIRAAVQVAFTF